MMCLPKFHKQLNEYIEEYKPYVEYVIKKRKFLERYWEDLIQLVITELIKVYYKRDKYTDFDWVTRSVIRRKAIMYTSYYLSRDKNLIFPDQLNTDKVSGAGASHEDDGIEASVTHFRKSIELFAEQEKTQKIIEYVKDIQFKLNNSGFTQFFSDWDRELVNTAIELYELGADLGRKDMIECMGYDETSVNEFNSKMLSLRNKLVKYFGDEYMEFL